MGWSYVLSRRREKAENVANFCLTVIFLGCVILWTVVVDFLCCTQVLMCCCTFVCGVFSEVRQVHPRAGAGLPSNTMRHSRVSDSGHQAPVYLNPSFSPSQSINSAGFKILIVSLAKKIMLWIHQLWQSVSLYRRSCSMNSFIWKSLCLTHWIFSFGHWTGEERAKTRCI